MRPVKTRILLAEDDALLRDLMSKRLAALGYAVLEAVTGEEALTFLTAGDDTHVLVTDISMPGPVDGWSLGEASRLLNPLIAVIYTSSGRPIAARQVPGSVFVAKPYRPDEVIAAIRKVTELAVAGSGGK